MISWLQKHMLPCAFKMFFGIDCPICGFQRSLVQLLEGNVLSSLKIYPPLIFVIALIFGSVAFLFFPSFIKQKYLQYYSVFVLSVITANYIFKIVTNNI